MDGIKDEKIWAYFVHSQDKLLVIKATADYGIQVPAIVESGLLYGTQFHPEKSGSTGRMMLENFLRECQK